MTVLTVDQGPRANIHYFQNENIERFCEGYSITGEITRQPHQHIECTTTPALQIVSSISFDCMISLLTKCSRRKYVTFKMKTLKVYAKDIHSITGEIMQQPYQHIECTPALLIVSVDVVSTVWYHCWPSAAGANTLLSKWKHWKFMRRIYIA